MSNRKENWRALFFLSGSLLLTLFSVFCVPQLAFAQEADLAAVGTAAGIDTETSLLEIIGNIISIFLGLLGVIFLVLVIYAGFLWMTSQGSEEKIKTAKNILKNATIGLVITLAAEVGAMETMAMESKRFLMR